MQTGRPHIRHRRVQRLAAQIFFRVSLAFFVVMGSGVCGGLYEEVSWADTDAAACGRGYLMKPGDTCAWTVEGDDVEIHVDPEACALVTSRNYMMRYSHPGPRLCPGGGSLSRQGLLPVDVTETIVASMLEAPLCGVLSISRPSIAFNGADIRVWPGLDLQGVLVRWSGVHWSVEETPGAGWTTPKRRREVSTCQAGQQLGANDMCRHGDHIAVVGPQAVRVDVWEDRKVGPDKWVVDPTGACHALASMSARPFSSISFAGLQLVWDQEDRSWTIIER